MLACLLLTGLAAAAENQPPALTAENIERFFDVAFATQIQDHRIVGAVVSVVHRGEVVHLAGYGWADLESRTPASPVDSLFRIASISKPFVWTAVMQLVEEGRLTLDDDVNDHLTAFKIPDTFEEPIRVRHLLTHTPGFEDQAIGLNARSLEERIPLETYLAEHMPARVRPPGEHAAYSNWGTTLAAYIVQEVSGQNWADYIDEHILLPLGMTSTNTHTIPSERLAERIAASYVWSHGRFQAMPYEQLNDEPAGMISTTADDMSRFMLAHLNLGAYGDAQILSEATARQMHSPLFAPHPDIRPMLHGFYRSDRNGQIIFGHGGDTNQFHSNMSLFPEHDLGIFISFNSDPADAARSGLISAFVDYFFPLTFLRKAPEPVSGVSLSEFTGEYVPLRSNQSTLERLGTLVTAVSIEAENDELIFAGNSRWIPRGNDMFVGRYREVNMLFERTDGEVTHVIIGNPLSTFEKVSGLNSPRNATMLMVFMMFIAVVTVVGYGTRAFVPAPADVRLPRPHVLSGWLHSVLLMALYAYLGNVLAGDVEEFVFGVPDRVHVIVWLLVINTLLGLAVLGFSIAQWRRGAGTLRMRICYSLVGLAALINLWVAWHFNLLTHPFS
jgi:CubicO group peptidase (beta-lactamase class C family)/uncharacterized membrane protein YuzA (DUF378 family)